MARQTQINATTTEYRKRAARLLTAKLGFPDLSAYLNALIDQEIGAYLNEDDLHRLKEQATSAEAQATSAEEQAVFAEEEILSAEHNHGKEAAPPAKQRKAR